jgi:outer membrane receptor for ferrienterochelin and colicins
LILACSMPVFAQETVKLKLVDETGEGLPGVSVKLINKGKAGAATLSDVDGEAAIVISSFPAKLEISNLGYNSFERTITEAPAGILTIALDKKYTGLNEVVVTGVGRPTKLDEAVSVYKIISAADIRSQGAVNLQDALRNQLGINIGQDAMLGGTIKMQGMSGDNVKILVDGLPLNGREGQNIDLSTVNLAHIEKIEVAQGPMSIMYGADALGGVINLITKSNKDSWNLGADAFYESIGKYNFGVNGGWQSARSNITAGAGRNFFQGWDPNYDTVRNTLWRPKEQYFGNFKYTYKLSDNASLTYGTDYMNDKLTIKGGLENFSYYNRTVNDEELTTQRWMNRLQAKWKTGNSGYWESNNSYSMYNRLREGYITDLSTMEKKLNTAGGAQSKTIFNDFTFRTTYNNNVGILNYTFGYDINLQFASGVEKLKGGKQEAGDYALFLVTDINVTDNLKIQPALRAAYNSKYNAPLIPSFSILYKPNKVLQVRGSYARGFRAPTLKELYLDFKDSNHDVFGNPGLKAEDGHHAQASIGYMVYQQGKNYNNITLTGFYNNVRNQISLARVGNPILNEPPPYSYVNIGRFENLHFQLQSQNQWGPLYLMLGASFNQNMATASTISYNYWEGNVNARYDLPSWNAGFALFYKYTGTAPLTVTDVTGSVTVGEQKANDYHNLDASIEKGFLKNKIFLTAGLRNIFDNTIVGTTGANSGGPAGGHGGGGSGMNLTTGRSFFASLRLQLGN